jgi:hypothetical protein
MTRVVLVGQLVNQDAILGDLVSEIASQRYDCVVLVGQLVNQDAILGDLVSEIASQRYDSCCFGWSVGQPRCDSR